MNRRGPLLILISLIFAVGAAWLAKSWLAGRVQASRQATVTVVVAKGEIPFGTRISDRNIATIQMLKGTVPPGAITDKAQVKDRVARISILPGEPLLEGKFVDGGAGSTLAAIVERDKRAVTVRVDDVVGVAGFLLPGNRVDVLATRRLQDGSANSRTILQNVKVLAVDQTATASKSDPVVVRAVTLEVAPDEALKLAENREQGTLQLTLRNPFDGTEIAAPVVAAAPPRPQVVVVQEPRPVQPPRVTVIRGTAVGAQSGE